MHKKHFLLLIIISFQTNLQKLKAQDTLQISIAVAQQIFMKENMALIAGRFEIDIAEAAIVQASMFNNPEIEITANGYNPENKKVLDISNPTGEYGIRIEQLFTMGKKRKKAIHLAQSQYDFSQNAFIALLRDLIFKLRSNLYSLHFLQKSHLKLNQQALELKLLSDSFERLQKKQLVTADDALRMKTLHYTWLTEMAGIRNEMEELQKQLRVLLNHSDKTFVILPEEISPAKPDIKNWTLDALLDSGRQNRPELQMALNQVQIHERTYSMEKALAVPDLKAGVEWSRRAAFVPRATMLDVGLSIPLFNRNQGNIQVAKIGIKQAETLKSDTELQIENDIRSAYLKALNAHQTLQEIDGKYFTRYENMLKILQKNLEKQQISILEFVQFHEAYRESMLQYFNLQKEKMQTLEELNYAVGKLLFN